MYPQAAPFPSPPIDFNTTTPLTPESGFCEDQNLHFNLMHSHSSHQYNIQMTTSTLAMQQRTSPVSQTLGRVYFVFKDDSRSMSSSASSSGYNSGAHSIEIETSPSFYANHQPNAYSTYPPQVHLYSQHTQHLPPGNDFNLSPREERPHQLSNGYCTSDWMALNGPQAQMGFEVPPPAYVSGQHYGQS